jgi:ERCC4-type nuclease
MSKLLLIDTREKPKAIQRIIKTVDEARIPHESTKLLFGDYMDYNRPSIVIDRKQNIAELARNCTWEHDRFRAELERAKAANARLIILVEQNRYKDRDKWIHVESIEDIMLWTNPHTTIRGEKVFRILRSWMSKYDIDVQFCDKRQTGRRILEIIYG